MTHVRQQIRCSHCLQHIFTPNHLLNNHVYAIENTYAKQSQHQIKPLSDIQAMMKTDTHAKDHNDGSINATTHQYHLSEVGTCGLYVVDSHGYKRKTGRIDENVNDTPRLSSTARKPNPICMTYCIANPIKAITIIHRERSYRLFSHLTCR